MGAQARKRWPPRRVLDETTRQILVGDGRAVARPPLEGPLAAAAAR